MIHITIPDTQTLIEPDKGRSYEAYNLHVNGAYHASVRYSNLLRLHEKLQEHFGSDLRLAEFPAKKLFRKLDKNAINERRIGLAKYFQSVVQQPPVAQHHSTEWFFLSFQVESFRPSSSNVSVDIYLPDGSHETVRCGVQHPTEMVLKRFADIVGLEPINVDSFGLFIARKQHTDGDGQLMPMDSREQYPDLLCVRLLRNFESPYISLQLLNRKSAASGLFYRIVVRKLVWDPKVELSLFNNPGAVLLLYKQAVCELRNGGIRPSQPAALERLYDVERQSNCTQFLRLCHAQPSYGYEVFEDCVSDYPRPDTLCGLKVGRRHIVLTYSDGDSSDAKMQAVFRATRIRVWRIAQHSESDSDFIFQFEYLMSKDTFENITLRTKQAVLLSLIMQSFGSEILREQETNRVTNGSAKSYTTIDESFEEKDEDVAGPSGSQPQPYEAGYHVSQEPNVKPEIEKEPTKVTVAETKSSESTSVASLDVVDSVNGTRGNLLKECGDSQDLFVIISSALPSNYSELKITDDDL